MLGKTRARRVDPRRTAQKPVPRPARIQPGNARFAARHDETRRGVVITHLQRQRPEYFPHETVKTHLRRRTPARAGGQQRAFSAAGHNLRTSPRPIRKGYRVQCNIWQGREGRSITRPQNPDGRALRACRLTGRCAGRCLPVMRILVVPSRASLLERIVCAADPLC